MITDASFLFYFVLLFIVPASLLAFYVARRSWRSNRHENENMNDYNSQHDHRRMARIIKKSEFAGAGALVQLFGLVAFFILPMEIGVVVGILLLIIGGRMAIIRVCSDCRAKVDKQASVCPHCRATLIPHD